MKRMYFWAALTLVICTGCAVMDAEVSDTYQTESYKNTSFNQFYRVNLGSSPKEVNEILGYKINIGFQKDEKDGDFKAIEIDNPYKSVSISVKEKTYKVDYYFKKINKADGVISDDELMPFVFENDRLIGKGADYLFRVKNQ